MTVSFREFSQNDAGLLADFLSGQDWPFHSTRREDRDAVIRRILDGHFDEKAARTFWVEVDDEPVGMIQLREGVALPRGVARLGRAAARRCRVCHPASRLGKRHGDRARLGRRARLRWVTRTADTP
jgi:hypothetical protein